MVVRPDRWRVTPRGWLVAIVIVSALVRIELARRIVAPWIMVDELEYSELAKSFAAHGHFLIRGVSTNGEGFVYPLLIAPAYRLFTSVPDAYRAAKVINAGVMSLAAIPAYHLARRVLVPRLALIVAALSVLIPSMLYTGELMTENVFYPLFLTCALALVVTLERPTWRRQVILIALCALAYVTRAQAISLIPAVVCAPILLVLVERRGSRGLRPFATLYGIVIGGGALALLVTGLRGRSPLTLLGAYRAATTSTYSVGGVLRFFVYHVSELDLYLGIAPFAALLALWLAPRTVSPAARAFAVASLALVFWLLVEVAAFASQPSVDRIEERNMFYLAPLGLIALLGLAADGVVPKSRRPLLAAAVVAAALPVFIPYARFVGPLATADTLALLPWWGVHDHGVPMVDLRWVALAVGVAAVAVFLWLPRRFVLLLPVLVGVYFVGTSIVVEHGRHGIEVASAGKLQAGIQTAHLNWIDRAVGPNASVAVLYTGKEPEEVTWENEFFNRSVGKVFDLAVPPPDPLPATEVVRRSDGTLAADGRPVDAQYLLAGTAVDVKGKLLELDGKLGVGLYDVGGPVVVLSHITGLYPTDTWSHRVVTYSRVDCRGGTLSVQLQSDPSLFKAAQVVTATEAGRVVARVSVAPTATPTLIVRLHAGAASVCTVSFRVAHLANPSLIEPGSTDDRLVGVRFQAFSFKP